MSEYLVSARKYRPDSFETLVGQDNIAKTLKNSILRGKLAHAYLFCGPRGVGKTSTARIFAKAINCSNPTGDMEPCGECESCRSFAEGRSYCIHELDAASNNGVEDIKALMDKVQIPPQVGKYSVYIIDEVHMLSQQAFNAFLKTLEEPPAHAIFILATTEKHKIIPTILSRCQTYDFNRISIPDMVSNLKGIAQKEGVNIDEESLHIIAQKADGAMRDALTIFDQTVAFCGTDVKYEDVMRNLNVLDYEYSFRLVDAFLSGNYADALLIFDEVLAKGFNALYFVSALSSHFRDLIVSRTSGLDSLLDLPASLKQRYSEQSSRCSLKFLYDALDVSTQCEMGYKASVNPRLHIEFALMKLSFLKGMSSETIQAPATAVAPATVQASAPKPEFKAEPAPAPEKAPEPVSKPEPVPVPATEPAPAPKRKPTGAAALSFSALMSATEETEEVENTAAMDEAIPSDEEITAVWKRLAASYETQPRLANALLSSALEFSDTGDGTRTMTFKVMNVAQQNWIKEQKLRELETKLRSMALCEKIRLEVAVVPEEAVEEKPYMPAEQAKDLMQKNPEVKNLVIDLGLDAK